MHALFTRFITGTGHDPTTAITPYGHALTSEPGTTHNLTTDKEAVRVNVTDYSYPTPTL
jgi:hypothetical protein